MCLIDDYVLCVFGVACTIVYATIISIVSLRLKT